MGYKLAGITALTLAVYTQGPLAQNSAKRGTEAFFGAVHVHTKYSFDGYTNGSLTTPADAYRWAMGKEITNSGIGGQIKISKPLDFYAVSDHAEWMGVFKEMVNPDSPLSKHPLASRINL